MQEFKLMSVLHDNLIGLLPEFKNHKGQRGFRYCLSVVISCTRYLCLLSIRDKTAETVANALIDDIISRISVPYAILTVLDGESTEEVMMPLCQRLNIDRLRTTAFHPQCDCHIMLTANPHAG
jgi:hypothetical protein